MKPRTTATFGIDMSTSSPFFIVQVDIQSASLVEATTSLVLATLSSKASKIFARDS